MTTRAIDIEVWCDQPGCGKRARKIVRLLVVEHVTPMVMCSNHTAEVLQRAVKLLDGTRELDDVIQVDHLEQRIYI